MADKASGTGTAHNAAVSAQDGDPARVQTEAEAQRQYLLIREELRVAVDRIEDKVKKAKAQVVDAERALANARAEYAAHTKGN